MELASLTAAAIATLVITKGFERTGEVIVDKLVVEKGGQLMRLLLDKHPHIASALQRVQDTQQAVDVSKDLETVASINPEVANIINAIAHAVRQTNPENTKIDRRVIQKDNKYAVNQGQVDTSNIGDTYNYGKNH
ncbi:hypothetical protein F7734_26895 [Scytonema sp. UIC 10036]|uniref:hypothetical protein n=1 Tax=Scytonema sp. UIC 10036 TaxID=2304196 RepID=UPI0012DAA86A|nr:hypothetical protein [Scytonema sp. UIC 10036]MUG95787.1 hypothetical protein [Scytonema sp. UIC 10036]